MKQIMFAMSLLAGLVSITHAAGNAAAGKTKSAACAACHNADGNSSANPLWPKLAGQHQKYIAKQLKDFKAGKTRRDPLMAGMVAALSEQDMADLGAYFESQTRKLGRADKKLVTLGEKVYRGGNATTGVAACIACHGPTGAGNAAAGFPAIGGQHAAYSSKALNDFKSGARSNDPNKMMRDIAGRMSDDEIKAVSDYIGGLH